ncbi:hypothetical protein [Falsibacillus pallidus]|uniref:N-acetyltransferase domain-containing protein n=1 Tax=Falsibacillus pallidus TaxID=493781 RepID=A0A370GB98_9BACI|nr:hypothetical protein [Falsibacillus pallidus]RDI41102.1 hypothetical protein DFR59_110106 [Falsibacillus pallidus]
MQFTIKKYETKYEKQLIEILQARSEDENILQMLKSPSCKIAYGVFVEAELAALFFGWTGRFHPFCLYFRIVVSPSQDETETAEQLLAWVQEQEKMELPLQTSLWETRHELIKAYEKMGFEEIRRTYMPRLKVGDAAPPRASTHVDLKIKTLKEIMLDEPLMNKLARLVKTNYENTHLANPVAQMEIDDWKKLILADDTLLDGSYICLDERGGEIAAYSFLHDSEEDDAYELGWCGESQKKYTDVINHLVSHQIYYSRRKGVSCLIGEFDTTDEAAMAIMKSFPFETAPAWITYQREYGTPGTGSLSRNRDEEPVPIAVKLSEKV